MTRLLKSYRRLIIGSRFVLYTNLTDRLFSFIIFLILARHFSSEIYGQLIIIFTVSTVFINIFDLGLGNYIQREIAHSKNQVQEIFSKVFAISIYIIPVYLTSVFICYRIIYPELSFSLFLIIAIIMYESTIINICNRTLSGFSDYRSQFSAFWISRLLILSFFILLTFILKTDLTMLMLVMMAGFLYNTFLVLNSLKKYSLSLKGIFTNSKHLFPLIKITYPLGLAVLFNYLYDKIDLLLISKFLNYDEVAYYNIGYGVFKTATLSFSFILFTGFTQISFLSRNVKAVKLFLKKYTTIIIVICLIATAMLYLFAEQIIIFFYTENYFDSIIVLKILSFALIAVGLNNLCGITLNGMKQFKTVMIITVAAVILNIALNIYVIPIYGIIGASFITVSTEYFILFFESLFLLKLLRRSKAS